MSGADLRTNSIVTWARSHRLTVKAGLHLLLYALSWFFAFSLAYNFHYGNQPWFRVFFLPLLPVVVGVKFIVFHLRGLHRGSWRYVGMRDLTDVIKSAWISFALIFAAYFGIANLQVLIPGFVPFEGRDFPDSVLLLDFAGTIALVCGARIAIRLYHEEVAPNTEGALPRLLVCGAGNSGENVLREIQRQPVMQYQIVGFVDDDPAKLGARIHGVDVLGTIDDIKEICEAEDIDEILIAMPSATRDQIRRVVDQCKGANLRFKTLPAITDLIAGRAQVQQIRDVDINDLLGRDPVTLDVDQIGAFLAGRCVMVTGAGGSIGSEMCRQVARFKPKRIALVEQAEENLFHIERELRATFPEIDVAPHIADICDNGRVTRLFETERPSVVFHAAAHKHVPMMEANPGEAIKNNIRGTRTVADAANAAGCEKFVMISTDKAVNPTSIMGCSKRVAEMYIQALNERSETQFVTVRFGNVLGSSGSVVPIFKEQIACGGPVTVTHPEMVRFFMTIPEAAQLVLQAGAMGDGGEIYVLDMGEPVKIVDLARDLITLSGFRPDEDIDIVFTGMRPGEKLYEELMIEGEDIAHTSHPKIGIWRRRAEDWDGLVSVIEALLGDADMLDRDAARQRLKAIVPEFLLESLEGVRAAGVSRLVDDAAAKAESAA